jgi:aryl-alcohol dehydrogenase-like predicted oxidoreductase
VPISAQQARRNKLGPHRLDTAMQHLTFGRNNGLRVSELALGAGNFGTRWGYGSEPEAAREIFDKFADAGGTFIDTAASYQVGESEENLGKFLAGRRDQFTVATKFAIGGEEGYGPLQTGNGRRAMFRSVEGSLRRLATDYIDLLWVHFPDDVTPVYEIVRALDDLARAGKILYAGLSNFPAWRTSRAVTLAEMRGLIPIAGIQFEYSLVERSGDRENFPMAEALGLGAALWSPLGGGLLTGKYRSGSEGRLTDWQRLVHTEDDARKAAVVDAVLAASEQLGALAAEVAVAWLLERARRSSTGVVPIIGPRTTAQLDSYLAALNVDLGAEIYERLDEVSRIDLGQPYNQLATERARPLGGDVDAFRAHPVPTA